MSASPTTQPIFSLHSHSTMSVLDGASPVSHYLKHAKDNGHPVAGITDHGLALGLHELITKAPEYGVKPLAGIEFYLMPRPDHKFAGDPYKYYHMTVWATSQVGYRNLSTLASRSWDPSQILAMPFGRKVSRITFEDLLCYNEGLVIGSGCILGPFGKALIEREPHEAARNLAILWETFRGRMFFEIMPNGVKDDFVSKNMVVAHYLDEDRLPAELHFHPKDKLHILGGEWMPALDLANTSKPISILAADPIRSQGRLLPDYMGNLGLCAPTNDDNPFDSAVSPHGVQIDRWELRNGAFIGNECCPDRPDGCLQRLVNDAVIRTAHQLGAPLILTLDAHFVKPETKAVQDILLMNGNKDGWHFSTVYSQMNTQEAWEKWEEHHKDVFRSQQAFQEGVENNQVFADMVEPISFTKAYHLPEVEIPEPVRVQYDGHNDRLLRLLSERIAFHGRMPTDDRLPAYMERLQKELDVIANNPKINFLPYFLIIDLEVTGYMKSMGKIVGPGRGSAAGSLLSFLLGITAIDPIKWGLSFERFLSNGRIARGKFPDIDLDFGEPKIVIDYLTAKYGPRFARISTTTTMKLKGAIRDVCRILLDTRNKPAMSQMVDEVCLPIPLTPQGLESRKWLYGYEDSDGVAHQGYIEQDPRLQKLFAEHPRVKAMVDEVLSVPRAMGRHASAYCLSDIPISEIVPMCVINDESCTQFTMGPVEALGLIKMDFLGINTLNDIEGAIKMIKERHGVDLDPWDLPLEGESALRTFKAFTDGRTETVFQYNTSTARPICMQVGVNSIGRLSAITANGRPGTMDAELEDGTKLIDAWISRVRGDSPVVYVHPDLEEILAPTQGIFVYQEQVMATFQKCLGWTQERADEVREIIGKKQKEKMDVLIPEIRSGLERRGWTLPQAETFISLCKAASNYSFNLSHSVSYALTGYTCMWLKCNYPLEWWASVLNGGNHEDLEKCATYVREVVVPPDVNKSDTDFYIIDDEQGKIVFPLNRIKRVGKAGIVINKLKPFASFEDFYNKIERRVVNKGVVMALIFAGAFDVLCGARSKMDRIEIAKEYLKLRGDKKMSPELEAADEADVLRLEDEHLAIGNADFTDFLRRKTRKKMYNPVEFRNAFGSDQIRDNDVVSIGGIIRRVTKTVTKAKKEPMGFIDIGNQADIASITFFPREFERFKKDLKEDELAVVDGRVNLYKGKLSIVAQDIRIHRDKALLADFSGE